MRLYIFVVLCFHACAPDPGGNTSSSTTIPQNLYKCTGRVHDSGEATVSVPPYFMADGVSTSFPLHRKELNCKRGRFKVVFQAPHHPNNNNDNHHPNELFVSSTTTPDPHQTPAVAKVLETDPISWKTSSHVDASVKIQGNGYLRVGSDFFHPDEYCFDQMDDSEVSLFVCYPECYGQRPCVPKCCAMDEVWDVLGKKCTSVVTQNSTNPKLWTPVLFSRSVDSCVKRVTSFHNLQLSVHVQQRLPNCDPDSYQLIPLRKIHQHAVQRFRVLWTGNVIVRDKKGNWTEFEPGHFCVDGMTNFGHGTEYTGDFQDQTVLACPDQVPEVVNKKPIPLRYALMLLIAAGILLFTALISGLLWDRQSVYEWTVSCEVVSMFFMILFVGIAHTIARKPEKSDFNSIHCVFIGAASHFFWLATFCWLFIINFEIWWNFRSLVQLRQSRKWFRFSIYQLVGWGCPLITVSVGLLLDTRWGLQNEDLDCTSLIVPNYGQVNCYVSKSAQGPYLFYPIGVILGCNLVFYLLTVCKMWGYQKKSQAIIQYRSRGQTQPILIFAKLFIVMGVSWIFEIVSWAITPKEADRIPLYWVIFDIVTLFQAISIFVIFIWKQQVLSRLWYKFPILRPLLSVIRKLPGCVLLPNERDRFASLAHTNKLPRGNSIVITRHVPPQANGGDVGGQSQLQHNNAATPPPSQLSSPSSSSPEQLALSSV